MRYGKVWGVTRPLLMRPGIEVHELRIKAGAFCSEHRHNSKFNMFFVVQGELLIKTWKNDYNLIGVTTLQAGESTIQRPGEKHRFEAVTDVHCLEIYWAELDPNDIVRDNVGGST